MNMPELKRVLAAFDYEDADIAEVESLTGKDSQLLIGGMDFSLSSAKRVPREIAEPCLELIRAWNARRANYLQKRKDAILAKLV